MIEETDYTADDFELDMFRSILASPQEVPDERMEEEIDISELPESEQEAIRQRAAEKEAHESHLSPEERAHKLYSDAVELARLRGFISVCTIQRYLYTGFGTAARLIDSLHEEGRITPSDKGYKVYSFVR